MEEELYPAPANEGGWRRHMEALIPLALLILVGLVILGKTTNVLCPIPGIGDLMCGIPGVKILVLGDLNGKDTNVAAPMLGNWLNTEATKYHVYTVSRYPIDVLEYNPDLINDFDIVVLVGERKMSYGIKEILSEYVSNGGRLILIGDAGTRFVEEQGALGWGRLQDVIPVQLKRKGSPLEPEAALEPMTIHNPALYFTVINHRIATAYYTLATKFPNVESCSVVEALDVYPNKNGRPLAILKDNDTGNTTLAIVESTSTLFQRGKVIYFAYDPGCTPLLWVATLEYLMNADLLTGKRF